MSDEGVTREDVVRAAETIRGRVRRTPLLDAAALAPGLALKAELFQHTGSFKARGVSNRLAALSGEERRRGVAGVSAGNHAIALAWGAAAEGLDCIVFSWESASPFKLDRARSFGATVDTEAEDPSGAFVRLEEHLAETGATLVHPFDDPLVLAGQGTVGLEILEDAPRVDVIVVPVGGGGLVSGITVAAASRGARIVAVEPEGSPALARGLEAGKPVAVVPRTIAGGLDAPFAGRLAIEICRTAGRGGRHGQRRGDRGGDAPPLRGREARLRAGRRGGCRSRSRGPCRSRANGRRRLGRQRRAGNCLWYPGFSMKADIHPEYVVAHVTCSCGNEFMTRSTKAELHVEVCSACHPFYTGKQKLMDSGGRVERFQRRLEKAAAAKSA